MTQRHHEIRKTLQDFLFHAERAATDFCAALKLLNAAHLDTTPVATGLLLAIKHLGHARLQAEAFLGDDLHPDSMQAQAMTQTNQGRHGLPHEDVAER